MSGNRFVFQEVNHDTNIIFIDDITKNFNFENNFSIITDGITIEKKNQDAFTFSPEDSPKIAITTNYQIKGTSDSFNARRLDLEILPYYNANFTPAIEFKQFFFNDWNESEWNDFDFTMIKCAYNYLSNDSNIQKLTDTNLNKKQLIAETRFEFYEFSLNKFMIDTEYVKSDIYNEFLEFSDLNEKELTKNEFTKYLQKYAEINKLKYIKGQKTKEAQIYKHIRL